MSRGSGLGELVLGLLAGNIGYLFGTLILSETYEVTAPQLVNGALEGTMSDLISAWIVVGAILTVADFVVIFGGLIALLNSGR